jgi:membrane protein YqaA with SNARE-associated domain
MKTEIQLDQHSISPGSAQEESLVRIFAQTIFTLFILVGIVVFLGIYAREELIEYSEKIVQYVGYPGLFFGMLLSDSLPAFIPPDAFLMFSIAASMNAVWVIISCSLGSILGGTISFWIGRYVIPRFSLGRRIILRYEAKLIPYIRRFGFWAVVLAAMTPIPYSWMAYSAGSFKMEYRFFLLGSLFRILRMGIYYYAMLWGWV